LPHLDAAYNLARWLTRDDHDAEDLVQAAYLRALKAFDGFHGANARAWMLTIVRNACYTWLEQKRARGPATAFDEEIHGVVPDAMDPEKRLVRDEDRQRSDGPWRSCPWSSGRWWSSASWKVYHTRRSLPSSRFPWVRSCPACPRARERLHQRLVGCGD